MYKAVARLPYLERNACTGQNIYLHSNKLVIS